MERKHYPVLDFVRALAIIHIFSYHYLLEWFHGSFLIVPEGFAKNVERLQLFHDAGLLGFFKNIPGFLFGYGFASVSVFLVLSGFVLTFGLSQKSSTHLGGLASFFWKKMKRILVPLYVSIVIGIALIYLRNLLFPPLAGGPNFQAIDLLKILFPPLLLFDIPLLQRFNGDLWYISIILQFYLLFPLLLWLLKKLRPGRFLALMLGLTLVYRFFATYGYQLLLPIWRLPFLDSAPMGVIYPSQNSYYGFSFFLPHLFEFAFGMSLCYWEEQSGKTLEKLMSLPAFLLSFVVMIGGFSLDFFRSGWIFSDAVIAVGLFGFLLNLGQIFLRFKNPLLQRFFKLGSAVSYEIYLLHHYFLNYLLLPMIITFHLQHEGGFWIFMPVFFVIAITGGYLGKKLSDYATFLLSKLRLAVV